MRPSAILPLPGFAVLVLVVLGSGPLVASGDGAEASTYLERIELRAMVTLPGGEWFSLRDPETDRSFWIGQGESRPVITALEFDPVRQQLRVAHGDAVRDVPLAHARIRSPDEIDEAFRARIRAEWREREEKRQAFQERWQAALEEYPEMRELERHLRGLMDDVAAVRDAFEEVDESAPEYHQLEADRQTLAEEYRLFERYSRNLIAQHPAFEPEDVRTVELLQHLIRFAWPEVDVEH